MSGVVGQLWCAVVRRVVRGGVGGDNVVTLRGQHQRSRNERECAGLCARCPWLLRTVCYVLSELHDVECS